MLLCADDLLALEQNRRGSVVVLVNVPPLLSYLSAQVFFAACQGLMYTLCYHLSGLLQDTPSGEKQQCSQQKQADRLLPRRPSNTLIIGSNHPAGYCPNDSELPLGAQQARGLWGDMLAPILQSR